MGKLFIFPDEPRVEVTRHAALDDSPELYRSNRNVRTRKYSVKPIASTSACRIRGSQFSQSMLFYRFHVFDDLVDQVILDGLVCRHKAVAIRVLLDFLEGLPRVLQ